MERKEAKKGEGGDREVKKEWGVAWHAMLESGPMAEAGMPGEGEKKTGSRREMRLGREKQGAAGGEEGRWSREREGTWRTGKEPEGVGGGGGGSS